MKRPADVRRQLERSFANQHRNWLAGGAWPLNIPLGLPREAEAMRQPDAVRAWASEWRAWRGPGQVDWVARQWRALGTQELPSQLHLPGPDAVAALIGQQDRWTRAQLRYGALTQRWPALAPMLGKLFDVLADYPHEDFQRLLDTVAWLDANPRSGLYVRQLPIAGLDSKWIEPRRSIVAELLAAIRGSAPTGLDFHELCGLARQPARLRLRLLDPTLRQATGGLADITAPVVELAELGLAPRSVLIVENLQTGLALPALPGTVAILGLGYAVQALAGLPWLRHARCFYWGDIDTHGFAILSKARTVLPGLPSVLMDEDTLLRHRELWSAEASQHGAAELPQLNEAEAGLYVQLKANHFGHSVRLEQERISWSLAMSRLLPLVAG